MVIYQSHTISNYMIPINCSILKNSFVGRKLISFYKPILCISESNTFTV